MGVGAQRHTPNTVQEAGWVPGPVCGAENLASTEIRSPERPAHKEFLYRLSYPGLLRTNWYQKNGFSKDVNEVM